MKIAIVGTRNWANTELVRRTVRYIAALDINSIIVSGGKPRDPKYLNNVDEAAENAADEFELAKHIYPAKWNHYGKTVGNRKVAGPARNATIAETADIAVIFWDGESRGTRSVRNLLESHGKPIKVIYETEHESYQIVEIRSFLDGYLKGGKQ